MSITYWLPVKTKISVGSKIKVKANGATSDFEIVGINEADPANGKISAQSPIGRALMGAKKGDSIDINVPAGQIIYKIVEIK